MALASTLCAQKNANLLRTDILYLSTWSYKTGKRIKSSGGCKRNENSPTRAKKQRTMSTMMKFFVLAWLFGHVCRGPCAVTFFRPASEKSECVSTRAQLYVAAPSSDPYASPFGVPTIGLPPLGQLPSISRAPLPL